MLSMQSIVKVSDNSGVVYAKIIKTLGGSFKKNSFLCDFVVVSSKKKKNENLIKERIFIGIVVSTVKNSSRWDGSYIAFGTNRIFLLNKKEKLLGSRVFGPVPFELSYPKYLRIAHNVKYML